MKLLTLTVSVFLNEWFMPKAQVDAEEPIFLVGNTDFSILNIFLQVRLVILKWLMILANTAKLQSSQILGRKPRLLSASLLLEVKAALLILSGTLVVLLSSSTQKKVTGIWLATTPPSSLFGIPSSSRASFTPRREILQPISRYYWFYSQDLDLHWFYNWMDYRTLTCFGISSH